MKLTLSTLLAIPLLAVSVHAEDKPAKPEKPKMDPAAAFKKLDANTDNSLSLEEFKASPRWKKDASKADDVFAKKDKDGNKGLSLEEFSAKPEKPAKPGKDAPAKDAK